MLQTSPIRPRACKVCKADFSPARPMQKACSIDCAKQIAESKRVREEENAAREDRRVTREKLERLKTRGDHIREVQAACNKYVRLRDFGKPCICCGAAIGEQRFGGVVDAGHWLSVGSAPHLRFHTLNIHAQLKSCNRPGGTTRAQFANGMYARIGFDRCRELEADQEPRKYTIEQLQRLKSIFRKKARRQEKRIQEIF